MSPARRVTLLSDFGTADGYAAAMAGVIAAGAPEARIDHASHAVPPGDILTAALTLSRYAFLYPPGTVHLVVVDPGVGTERRALAARVGERYFVAPDNGVLTRVLGQSPDPVLLELNEQPLPEGVEGSVTFHGRDLFAPAAARLARGDALAGLGSPLRDPTLLPLPQPRRAPERVEGEIIQVDRFGNLITNIPGDWVRGKKGLIRVRGTIVGAIRRTYGDVEPGALLALVGSLGMVEISVRDGNAADRLGAGRGVPVTFGA